MEDLRTLIERYRAAWERIIRETGDVDEVNEFFHLPCIFWAPTGQFHYSAPRKTSALSTARDWNSSERVA